MYEYTSRTASDQCLCMCVRLYECICVCMYVCVLWVCLCVFWVGRPCSTQRHSSVGADRSSSIVPAFTARPSLRLGASGERARVSRPAQWTEAAAHAQSAGHRGCGWSARRQLEPVGQLRVCWRWDDDKWQRQRDCAVRTWCHLSNSE